MRPLRATGRRAAVRSVVIVVALLLAASCGKESDRSEPATASDTASSSESGGGSSGSTGDPAATTLAIVAASAIGGRTGPPVRLDTEEGMEAFVGQFGPHSSNLPGTPFVERLQRAIQTVTIPDGQVLVGAVVEVSCDKAVGVEVSGAGDTLRLTATKNPSPKPECLVPVTSVALVAVPEDAAPVG